MQLCINNGENLIIDNLNNAEVSISSLQGQTLFTINANTKIEIETNKLLTGIYVLSIAQQNKVYHQKISIN